MEDTAMRRLISATCSFIVGSGIVLVCAQLATAADKELQGTWTATKAERDGGTAADVIGHKLVFSDDRFEIQSKETRSLYSGTIRVNANAKPAAIDFEHAEGGLKGKTWKGIYVLDGETLTICDNAENLDAARPSKFEAKSGSGYVLVRFDRAKP
jgi:uncharacterized protein (TIGR03067 family)